MVVEAEKVSASGVIGKPVLPLLAIHSQIGYFLSAWLSGYSLAISLFLINLLKFIRCS